MFEYTDPIKTGAILASLLWQQAPATAFCQVPHAPDRYAEAKASSHDTPIGLKEASRHRLWKVHVWQRAIEGATMLVCTKPEQLIRAYYVKPHSIELQFADRSFSLEIDLLGMPIDRIRWNTVTASEGGESMTVRAVKGETIPIDSSTLRYLVDKKYAAKMDAELKSLQYSRKELEEMAQDNPLPRGLFAQDGQVLVSESWK